MKNNRSISMPRISAGLLMYRIQEGKLQVLLAHPGGPLFQNKDDGAWTIPKGEIEPGEDLLECAKREFKEETGVTPTGPFIALTPIKQKGGKIVHA
jgi:predicted NUDIX family NTP pyrophosphohydrolase